MAKRRVNRGRAAKASKFRKAIQALRCMKPNQRCSAIRSANDNFIQDIVKCVRKLRTKKLSPKDAKHVKSYATKLRFISSPKVSLKRKRKTLSQKGGFLPALLPILGPLAASVIGPVVGGLMSGR